MPRFSFSASPASRFVARGPCFNSLPISFPICPKVPPLTGSSSSPRSSPCPSGAACWPQSCNHSSCTSLQAGSQLLLTAQKPPWRPALGRLCLLRRPEARRAWALDSELAAGRRRVGHSFLPAGPANPGSWDKVAVGQAHRIPFHHVPSSSSFDQFVAVPILIACRACSAVRPINPWCWLLSVAVPALLLLAIGVSITAAETPRRPGSPATSSSPDGLFFVSLPRSANRVPAATPGLLNGPRRPPTWRCSAGCFAGRPAADVASPG